MKPLVIRFSPKKEDYVLGIRAYYRAQPVSWIILAVFALIIALNICIFIISGTEGGLTVIFPVVLVFFFIIYLYILNPYLSGRKVDKSERLSTVQTWTFTAEDIRVSTSYQDARFDWGTFTKLTSTKTHYLLLRSENKRLFHIIPKRAFQTPGEEQLFLQLFRENLTKK